jgi:hypothetical protein
MENPYQLPSSELGATASTWQSYRPPLSYLLVAFCLLPLLLAVFVAFRNPSEFFSGLHGLESSLRFACAIFFCIALPTAAVLFMLSRRASVWVFLACLIWLATTMLEGSAGEFGGVFLSLVAAMFIYSLWFRSRGRLR